MGKLGLNIGIIITLLSMLIGGVTTFNKIQAKAEEATNKAEAVDKKVDKIDEKKTNEIEAVKKDNQEVEKAVTEQKIQLQYISAMLDKIDKKLEKVQ